MQIEQRKIDALVALALMEDVGAGDVTAMLIDAHARANATIYSQQTAVFCGKEFANAVFQQLDTSVILSWYVNNGDVVDKGQALCVLSGPTRSLLTGERSALNFLQLLSGTATLTRKYVDAIKGTKAKLLDTRKTLPGLRLAQKYAVLCGGGKNHRLGLFDAILIKENHIAAAGSLGSAVEKAKTLFPNQTVEVEVRDLKELQEALATSADSVMLDNFSLADIRTAVELNKAQKAKLEVSGGVSLETIRAIAETGVDYISVGAITKTLIPIEFTMLFEGL